MDDLYKLLRELKKAYDQGGAPLGLLHDLTVHALTLISDVDLIDYDSNCSKPYRVFKTDSQLSRPVLPTMLISDPPEFSKNWNELVAALDATGHRVDATEDLINKTLYTSAMSFAVCIDLWKPKSRKTPGTVYEIIMGSIMGKILPSHKRLKYISLPVDDEKVTTDIVFDRKGNGLVIPVKISTRERVVQPYAHQRILDSVFGPDRYESILICINETQRDDNNLTTNDICVPGTIKLFQSHLASLSGLFYLDPPERYLKKDLTDIIDVKTVGWLLTTKLPELVDKS